MKRWAILAVLVFLKLAMMAQADSTKATPARNFGLSANAGHTLMRLKSSAFFDPRNGEKGTVEVENAATLGAGVFYLFSKQRMLIGVEAVLSQAAIAFRTASPTNAKGRVYNVAVEIPVHYRFYAFRPMRTRSFYLSGGPRLVVNATSTDTSNPSFAPLYIAMDAAIGIKQPTAKAQMCVELYFSLGLSNLKTNAGDWRDQTIHHLYRDIVGLRFMFN
jgi:hypothetical protein